MMHFQANMPFLVDRNAHSGPKDFQYDVPLALLEVGPIFFYYFFGPISSEKSHISTFGIWPPGGQTVNQNPAIFNRKHLTPMTNLYTDFEKPTARNERRRALDGQTRTDRRRRGRQYPSGQCRPRG